MTIIEVPHTTLYGKQQLSMYFYFCLIIIYSIFSLIFNSFIEVSTIRTLLSAENTQSNQAKTRHTKLWIIVFVSCFVHLCFSITHYLLHQGLSRLFEFYHR